MSETSDMHTVVQNSKDKGKKGKLREVEGDEGDWEEAEWEEFGLEEPETEEGQVAMVVRSKPGEVSSAVPGSSSTILPAPTEAESPATLSHDYVEFPLDLAWKYHFRAVEASKKISERMKLPHISSLDLSERAAWCQKYSTGTEKLGAIVYRISMKSLRRLHYLHPPLPAPGDKCFDQCLIIMCEPVVHSVTHPVEYLLSTQGLGKDQDPLACRFRCHLSHCC